MNGVDVNPEELERDQLRPLAIGRARARGADRRPRSWRHGSARPRALPAVARASWRWICVGTPDRGRRPATDLEARRALMRGRIGLALRADRPGVSRGGALDGKPPGTVTGKVLRLPSVYEEPDGLARGDRARVRLRGRGQATRGRFRSDRRRSYRASACSICSARLGGKRIALARFRYARPISQRRVVQTSRTCWSRARGSATRSNEIRLIGRAAGQARALMRWLSRVATASSICRSTMRPIELGCNNHLYLPKARALCRASSGA